MKAVLLIFVQIFVKKIFRQRKYEIANYLEKNFFIDSLPYRIET